MRPESCKVPSRGPVTLTTPDGGGLRLWWSSEWRSWGVTRYDARGDQVGDSTWSSTRPEAVRTLRSALADATPCACGTDHDCRADGCADDCEACNA